MNARWLGAVAIGLASFALLLGVTSFACVTYLYVTGRCG